MESAAQLDELTAALRENQQQLVQAREQVQASAAAAANSQSIAEQRQQELQALTAVHQALQKVNIQPWDAHRRAAGMLLSAEASQK